MPFAIRPYLILALLCLGLYLPGLAAVPPLDRDESRFAQATKQMVETGDYVRIQFQDEIRAKKPVGVYWLQAASVKLTGAYDQIWAYRIPSLLGALAAVLLTYHFGQGLVGRGAAFVGAGLLAATLVLTLEAHQAKTDAVLLACVVAAQGALSRVWLQSRGGMARAGKGVILTFWLAIGFGILVKGPIVPLISLFTAVVLSVKERGARWLTLLQPLIGIVLVAAIVAPWAAAITSATEGQFLATAVKDDLLPKLIGGHESHGAPPGYYLALLPLMFWPATLLLIPGLVRAWRERRTPQTAFLLAWAIPAWIMFEAVPTKLPHYVLPTYPALALLAAVALVAAPETLKGWGARIGYGLFALVGLALAVAAVGAPFLKGTGFSPWSLPAALAALIGGVMPLLLLRREQNMRAARTAVVAALFAYGSIFHGVLPSLEQMWLSSRVAASIRPFHTETPVVMAGFSEPSAIFLLGTETKIGNAANAGRWLAANPDAIAVVEMAQHAEFERTLAEADRMPRLLDEIKGFNYSRGKPLTLRIYAVEP